MFTISQTEISDVEVLQEAVQDAPLDIVQLEPGKMTGQLKHLSVGTVGVSIGSFSRGFRARGVQSDRRCTLSINEKPVVILGFEVRPGDLFLLKPGHEIYATYSGANTYEATLIELDELFGFAQIMDPAALDAHPWREPAAVLKTDPAIAAARTTELRALLRVLAKYGPTMSAGTADYYKRCLLELVTAPIISGSKYRGPRLRSAELVRDIDLFLIEAGPRPVHISELCAWFDKPARTIYRAFYEKHGMSPRQFHQRKRLNDVHKALLMAVPGDTVTGIAIKHGFSHVGRFAGDYQSLFDELPSETLRRPAPFSGDRRSQ